jgi:hypothetical protein
MNELREAAREYHRMGFHITLCHGKRPIPTGWPSKGWTLREIDQRFRKCATLNVGTRFGDAANLVDIEIDSAEGESELLELFDGDIAVTPTFRSRRGPHRLFRWHRGLVAVGKTVTHVGPLEIRVGANAKGCQSLLPPSTTDGHTRKWLVSLDECPPAQLPDRVVKRIVDAAGVPINRETEIQKQSLCLSVNTPAVADAIRATIRSGRGHRHRRLFHLARLLKAIPELGHTDLPSIRPIVVEWHRIARPKIGTKEFEETWADFAIAWDNVRFPAGEEPIRAIFQAARGKPLPSIAEQYGVDSVKLLVGLCAELQRIALPEPFFLACRTAGELLGITHVMAHKWLKLLIADRVLEVAKPGSKHHATRFWYLGG